MKGGDPRRWLRGAVIGLGAGIVALAAGYLPLVDTYENRTFDLRARLFADGRRAHPDIVAVVVDQKSLDAIAAPRTAGGLEQGWPWPRDFHAGLVRYLTASGARAVVFDFVFSERSIYTQVGVADDDAAFADAASGQPVVQAIVLTREAGAVADRGWAPGLREAQLARRLPSVPAEHFDKATAPIPPLLRAAAGVGWIGFDPDDDGVARAVRPAVAYAPAGSPDAVEVWALSLAAAQVGGARVELDASGTRRRLHVNGREVPLDESDRLVLRFHGDESVYPRYSYASVLRSAMRVAAGHPVTEARPADFKDKIVLVGATAAGLLDLRATPMGAVVP
ncbi:MAG TPA: CHASE2 domain-containing protein, partial [Terriglobales bacterium]|nr:CHASE2 domain-containing protein [Terriglobales bacterium]